MEWMATRGNRKLIPFLPQKKRRRRYCFFILFFIITRIVSGQPLFFRFHLFVRFNVAALPPPNPTQFPHRPRPNFFD